ncbi:PC4 domain-containing protein [Forsythia ovata]|uniref:PC4 domain-containing protein n=1 Tax=Forsythia ovata TaxID=205694 RepID=A0ABD1U4C7_9LAMI
MQTKRRHTHIFCSKSQLKKSDEDEALSEGDEPPKKSSKPSAAAVDNDSDDSDHIVVYELSKNRKVSVRSWNGRVVVDIREFYYKDGKEMPGKKVNGMEARVVIFTIFLDLRVSYRHMILLISTPTQMPTRFPMGVWMGSERVENVLGACTTP